MDPEELAVILAGLWERNFAMIELDEIMRQREDRMFAEMLNRLRTATHTEEDICTLKSRIISPLSEIYPHDALHIFATRNDVDHHNAQMLSKQTEEKIEISSINKIPNVVKKFDILQMVGGLPYSLTLCKNARIMLIKNLDVSDGLVNGATGKILDIIHSESSSSFPKAIVIQFDNRKIGRIARQSSKISLQGYECGVPILPAEVKQNAGRSDSSPEITRIQFPVVLCWACTIHKVQGATLDKVVASFKKLRTKGQAYVAVSRATSLQGLFLLDFKPELIKADDMVLKEMNRLEEHTSSTTEAYQQLSGPSPNIVRVCFFNVQSLWDRRDVENDPYINTASILAMSETWQPSIQCSLKGYGYNISRGRSSENGGGVALFSKNYPLKELDLLITNCNIDAIAAHIPLSNDNSYITVLLLYCPPRTTVPLICCCIKDFIQSHRGEQIIIGGDFNINLNKTSNSVVKLLQEEGFVQVSNGPTHQSGSHIDHIWTNLHPLPTTFGMWTYYSDHKQTFIDIKRF